MKPLFSNSLCKLCSQTAWWSTFSVPLCTAILVSDMCDYLLTYCMLYDNSAECARVVSSYCMSSVGCRWLWRHCQLFRCWSTTPGEW